MDEAQAYVDLLLKLLVKYRADPEKCRAIQERDGGEGVGLLQLLAQWHFADTPGTVRVVERGTIESAASIELVCRVKAERTEQLTPETAE